MYAQTKIILIIEQLIKRIEDSLSSNFHKKVEGLKSVSILLNT